MSTRTSRLRPTGAVCRTIACSMEETLAPRNRDRVALPRPRPAEWQHRERIQLGRARLGRSAMRCETIGASPRRCGSGARRPTASASWRASRPTPSSRRSNNASFAPRPSATPRPSTPTAAARWACMRAASAWACSRWPSAGEHGELLTHAAPIVASVMGLLAAQGVGDGVLEPLSVDAASDAASVVADFADQAGRLLDHDRLSAYLLTPNRHAFERFAVATSPIVPGEGVVIPFEELGLRHIVITNRALVSEDLAADPRIVGREDRVIARAGFHGLLSVPLRREGRPIGVLNFVSKTPGLLPRGGHPDRAADGRPGQRLPREPAPAAADARPCDAGGDRARARPALARPLRHRCPGRADDQRDRGRPARPARPDPTSAGRETPSGSSSSADLELADIRRAVLGMSPRILDNRTPRDVVESTPRPVQATRPGSRRPGRSRATRRRLPRGRRAGRYRILQEALANVRFHSRAELAAGPAHVSTTA